MEHRDDEEQQQGKSAQSMTKKQIHSMAAMAGGAMVGAIAYGVLAKKSKQMTAEELTKKQAQSAANLTRKPLISVMVGQQRTGKTYAMGGKASNATVTSVYGVNITNATLVSTECSPIDSDSADLILRMNFVDGKEVSIPCKKKHAVKMVYEADPTNEQLREFQQQIKKIR